MKTMIIVTEGLEECEALLTYDLLYRAGIDVELIGTNDTITSSHNITFKAHKLLENINANEYECLVLPGGMPGTKNLEENKIVSKLIDEFVQDDKYIAAICAAPSILLHKGLLENEKFICYPGFESGYVAADKKVFQDKKFITAKGLGAAFEFAYLIICNLVNKEKAEEVLKQIQYY